MGVHEEKVVEDLNLMAKKMVVQEVLKAAAKRKFKDVTRLHTRTCMHQLFVLEKLHPGGNLRKEKNITRVA